jgi:hypothetical protein
MAELATDGGCLTVDMTDTVAIERALERLAGDCGLRRRLAEEAMRRTLFDWAAYGSEIGSRLCDLKEGDRLRPDVAGHSAARSVAVGDDALQALSGRLGQEARLLRSQPERFVQATDVTVREAVAE